MSSEQVFRRGKAFNANEPLVIHGSQLLYIAEVYPEIAQLARKHPDWESKRFIIFPASEAPAKLLKTLASLEPSGRTQNYPHPIHRGKILTAVVMHQTNAYKAYDPLYTWRLQTKRRR